jgi:hypothetical protein
MASWPCYVTSESMTSDLQASPLADGGQSAEGGQRGGIGMVPFITGVVRVRRRNPAKPKT